MTAWPAGGPTVLGGSSCPYHLTLYEWLPLLASPGTNSMCCPGTPASPPLSGRAGSSSPSLSGPHATALCPTPPAQQPKTHREGTWLREQQGQGSNPKSPCRALGKTPASPARVPIRVPQGRSRPREKAASSGTFSRPRQPFTITTTLVAESRMPPCHVSQPRSSGTLKALLKQRQ